MGMKNNKAIPETKPSEIEELIERVKSGNLSERERELVVKLLRFVLTVVSQIETKNATIGKLKRMIFGPRSEKQEKEEEKKESEENQEEKEEKKGEGKTNQRRGHGRRGAEEYRGAKRVECRDEKLRSGDRCPDEKCGGRVYDTQGPQIFVRVEGRGPVEATRYEQEVLRCGKCQQRYVAGLPAGVKAEKYDETADVMVAILKYGTGLPMYRMERLQESMGVPLPAGTQFERCEEVAKAGHPVYLELKRQAANGEVIHVDDTGVTILECVKENREVGEKERQGTQTTGIGAQVGANRIAFYMSGRQHAGENLGEVGQKRKEGLRVPIVMGDAENRNWTSEFEKIVSKCLAHARRKFVEVAQAFPKECGRVLKALGTVYHNETKTKEMTAQERLAYHQAESQPVMEALKNWAEDQLELREVEPNSQLGKALTYLLKHWEGLTQFLRVKQAPLDNNLAERILKRAVLHRKNAYFYKTRHGAVIGDIIMSLIESCHLNQINAFEYLVTLMREAKAVRARPGEWLPWNYQTASRQQA